MLIAELKLELDFNNRKQAQPRRKYNVSKLKKVSVKDAFIKKKIVFAYIISLIAHIFGQPLTTEGMQNACYDVARVGKVMRKEWLSDDTWNLIEDH